VVKKRDLKDVDRYYMEFGVDIHNRKLFLDEDIDDVSVGWIIRAIQRMLSMNNEEPIDLYINSYGGEIYSGLALYDVLEDLDVTVRTHATGKVCSMGFILYLVGDERFSTKRARFMHHEGSLASEGKISEIKDELKEMTIIENICNDIVKEKTGKNNKWWQARILRKEFWFGVKEAKEWGIITNDYNEEE